MTIVDLQTRFQERDHPRPPAPLSDTAFAAFDKAIFNLDQLGEVPGFRFAATLARTYRAVRTELRALEPGSPLLLRRLEDVSHELRELSETLRRCAETVNDREP